MTTVDTIALTLVAAALASMPVFALLRRGQPMDADVARRSASVLLGFWVRDWLMWAIGPVERVVIRAGISPDVFNYLGVAFGAAAGWAFAVGELSVGGWMVLFGGLADIFDGRIARARGIANDYGAFMDSTLDRFAEVFAFVGVAWLLSDTRAGAAISLLAISASLLVSYTRARGEAVGVTGAGGVMQRAERLVVLALAGLFDASAASQFGWAPGTLLLYAVTLIAVGALGTAVYRTSAIAGTLKSRT
ncbi:MAG: CDP-alcohol phosphatidyltransferase family protein [Acidimicrobiia bacterium]|nr:CDP-alcohol phosphatidyltransferase family protein [Acidimicrobiia bacterium]